jgi:hypothetical protein
VFTCVVVWRQMCAPNRLVSAIHEAVSYSNLNHSKSKHCMYQRKLSRSAATAGTGFAPLGNLRTTDQDGPYSLQYVPVQVAEVRGGSLAPPQHLLLWYVGAGVVGRYLGAGMWVLTGAPHLVLVSAAWPAVPHLGALRCWLCIARDEQVPCEQLHACAWSSHAFVTPCCTCC